MKQKLLLVFLLLNVVFAQAWAQQTITGTVTSKDDGEALPGVNVIVKGTTTGITTDLDGKYSLVVSDDATTLVFSFIGMTTQEVEIAGRTVVNVQMTAEALGVDEVVVTALGIKRDKKALGYAVQEVKGEALTEVRTTSVANALQGKVAGVNFSQSGSGLGGSTRVTIRGNSSLNDNNNPLWVVDGVPIDDSQQREGSGEWGGSDGAGAASQLNSEDIESISVLKGASAAALYGSRAANGVILVTTKKGKAGALKVNFNTNYTVEKVTDYYDFQNVYGQGNGGTYSPSSKTSFGPKMEGQMIDNWREGRSSYAMTPQTSRVEDFYRNGTNLTNNLAISGGSEKTTFRLSLMDSRNKGITPFHELNRQSADLNSGIVAWDKLKINAKVNFIKEKVKNRPYMGEYGTMMQFVFMPRSIRLEDLNPGLNEDGQQILYGGATSTYSNPYYQVQYGRNERTDRYRVISILSADWEINDMLTFSTKAGVDYYRDQDKEFGHQDNFGDGGSYKLAEKNFREVNVDALLKFNKQLNDDWTIGLNVGTSVMNTKKESVTNTAKNLIVKGLYTLGNGESVDTSEGYSEKEIQSVYGFGNIAYRNWAYLDFTARNDWSSTLPSDNRSFFYPSISASFVVSDMLKDWGKDLPVWISFAKVRASWAQVGNDTNPYRTRSTYSLKQNGTNETTYANKPDNLPFSDLKPEEQTSRELGFDIRLFNNRIGLDLAMYNTSTKNQILSIETPSTSGYKKRWINAGEIENKGIELALNIVPVKTENFNWDMTLNWSKNKNKIVELSKEYSIEKFGLGGTRLLDVYAIEGGEYGEIWGKKTFVRDEATGKVIVDENGMPYTSGGKRKVGSINPDWLGSISNRLTYKNFFMTMLIDIKKGGDLISMTDAHGTSVGTGLRSLDGREGGFVVDGLVGSSDGTNSGQQNTVKVDPESYWANIGGAYGVAEAFMYDAGFVKMRELSIGYSLPSSILNGTPFSSIKASLVGRNLFFIYRDTPGTNPEGSNGRKDEQQAYEISSLPVTSTFGFNLNFTF
ncbi:SusC/RagA family TonB-linked outer membrane protein [Puteibacter caeruleilacunae]|nr:SusC/RagA family TonB-linked outer membrane protein [Puteibacter caeruleilacunae]